jgi:hypothetical protein
MYASSLSAAPSLAAAVFAFKDSGLPPGVGLTFGLGCGIGRVSLSPTLEFAAGVFVVDVFDGGTSTTQPQSDSAVASRSQSRGLPIHITEPPLLMTADRPQPLCRRDVTI